MDDIVVGVNGSVEADEALDWALAEARSAGLRLVVVHAAPEREDALSAEVLGVRRRETDEVLERARARHGEGVQAEVRVVPGPAPDALLKVSAGAAMLVLGRRRRARIGRRVLGSVSTTVVENAEVPVTVVRRLDHDRSAEHAPQADGAPAEPVAQARVVVGVDTSEHSVAALRHGARVAARTGAVLDPVFAWQITTLAPLPGSWGWAPPIDDYENFARERLQAAVDAAEIDLPADRVRPRVLHGQAAKMLIDASAGADRMVVGTRGLGGFDRLVLGSTSRQVLDFAACPVTVLRS
ncbi:universal stress protein [Isoptericola jiangsuensis]|uniref:universal stress protein n=1 Tax=Isoptericola jiangsuensis TaxID=548579 RepID=UPI003AAD6003